MSDLVLTGWAGTLHGKMAAITMPLMESYANQHGMEFACANLVGERAAAWMKVDAIHSMLSRHERVVWMDCDVVVLNGSRNVVDELGDGWHALVQHDTECGLVPNSGVWVCSRHMLPVLESMWADGRNLDHPWWEQASLLEAMGYVVTDAPASTLDTPTTLYRNTTFLGAEWNHHPRDARRVEQPLFLHVTQYADRLSVIKDAAEVS